MSKAVNVRIGQKTKRILIRAWEGFKSLHEIGFFQIASPEAIPSVSFSGLAASNQRIQELGWPNTMGSENRPERKENLERVQPATPHAAPFEPDFPEHDMSEEIVCLLGQMGHSVEEPQTLPSGETMISLSEFLEGYDSSKKRELVITRR